ncbi:MAG: TlpA family protein disulfide reductase [Betaproteobacteria bacterium]
MRTKRILLLIALLLIIGAVAYAVADRLGNWRGEPASSVEEGGVARSFILRTLDGGEASLEAYRGKAVVVVHFWATWCPPCRAEIPDLIDFYKAHENDGVVVLAVNLREPESQVRDFAQNAGMDFPVLLDLSGGVANAYEIEAIPTTVVVDKSGIIRSRIVGMTNREQLESIVKPLL